MHYKYNSNQLLFYLFPLHPDFEIRSKIHYIRVGSFTVDGKATGGVLDKVGIYANRTGRFKKTSQIWWKAYMVI